MSRHLTYALPALLLGVALIAVGCEPEAEPVPEERIRPTAFNGEDPVEPAGEPEARELAEEEGIAPVPAIEEEEPIALAQAEEPQKPRVAAGQRERGEAQQPRQDKKEATAVGPTALAFPTGDPETSVLLIEATVPEEVRVGEDYTFDLEVTNLTENLMLEDVVLYLASHQKIDLLDVKVTPGKGQRPQGQQQRQGRGQGRQGQQQGQQANQQAPGGEQGQQANQQQGQRQRQQQADQQRGGQRQRQQQANQQQGQRQRGQQQGDQRRVWRLENLGPGESKVIQVTAVGQEEGLLANCIGVTYQPVLCVATLFMKPELELVKAAPDEVDICDPIEFKYVVRNTGTGPTKELVVRDPLPEGFVTADEEEEVLLEVGALEPGEEREFAVEVFANRTGEFGSRAVAETEGGLSVRSRRPMTRVVAADLALTATGPEVEVVGEPISYRVEVSNRGDVVAEDVLLTVDLPERVRSARVNREDFEVDEPIALGDIPPGESESLVLRLEGVEPGQVQVQFRATTECDRVRELEAARAVARTEIIAVPALLLAAFDMEDPIEPDEDVTYEITVRNQGSAPANNVQVVAHLPQQLEFVDANAEVTTEGQAIRFKAIEALEPGRTVQYHLTAKAVEPGDVQVRVELTSDYLDSPAIATEPTRVLGTDGNQRGQGQDQRGQGQRQRGQGQGQRGQPR